MIFQVFAILEISNTIPLRVPGRGELSISFTRIFGPLISGESLNPIELKTSFQEPAITPDLCEVDEEEHQERNDKH